MRAVHKFNLPKLGPEPRPIGNWRIRVGDAWFETKALTPEQMDFLRDNQASHDDENGVSWFRCSAEVAKMLGVRL